MCYHSFPITFIENEIFRRVNPDKLTMGEYWKKCVQPIHDINWHIALSKETFDSKYKPFSMVGGMKTFRLLQMGPEKAPIFGNFS